MLKKYAQVNDSVIIIPTFNEKENIREIIREIFALEKEFDILVVDDNSPDGTCEIVEDLVEQYKSLSDFNRKLYIVKREGKLGLGTAYIEGFRFALDKGYDYIFEMDADFSHDPHDLERLYDTAAYEDYDLVIGSRYIEGVNVVNWPLPRVLLSYFASKYVRIITGMPVNDTTAGFKCYKKSVLQSINFDHIKFIGYAFQIEMKYLAWKFGFKIKEIPIVFTDRVRGQSKMSINIFKEAVIGVLQMRFTNSARYHSP